jgi:hypothetical protein
LAICFVEAPTDGFCASIGLLLEGGINIHILSHGPGNEFQVKKQISSYFFDNFNFYF